MLENSHPDADPHQALVYEVHGSRELTHLGPPGSPDSLRADTNGFTATLEVSPSPGIARVYETCLYPSSENARIAVPELAIMFGVLRFLRYGDLGDAGRLQTIQSNPDEHVAHFSTFYGLGTAVGTVYREPLTWTAGESKEEIKALCRIKSARVVVPKWGHTCKTLRGKLGMSEKRALGRHADVPSNSLWCLSLHPIHTFRSRHVEYCPSVSQY